MLPIVNRDIFRVGEEEEEEEEALETYQKSSLYLIHLGLYHKLERVCF